MIIVIVTLINLKLDDLWDSELKTLVSAALSLRDGVPVVNTGLSVRVIERWSLKPPSPLAKNLTKVEPVLKQYCSDGRRQMLWGCSRNFWGMHTPVDRLHWIQLLFTA